MIGIKSTELHFPALICMTHLFVLYYRHIAFYNAHHAHLMLRRYTDITSSISKANAHDKGSNKTRDRGQGNLVDAEDTCSTIVIGVFLRL